VPKVVPEYKIQARAKIIRAALVVFRRKGLVHATMDDVAREIGVSKGAIYPYFPSRTQLLVGVMAYFRDELMPKMEHAAEHGDPAEEVARILDGYFEQGFEPALWHLLTAEAASDPEVREALRIDAEDDLRLTRGLLQRLETQGSIPHQADLDETARSVLMLVSGAIATGFSGGDATSARQTFVRTLRTIVDVPSPRANRRRSERRRSKIVMGAT